jgi:hypothetical protein
MVIILYNIILIELDPIEVEERGRTGFDGDN